MNAISRILDDSMLEQAQDLVANLIRHNYANAKAGGTKQAVTLNVSVTFCFIPQNYKVKAALTYGTRVCDKRQRDVRDPDQAELPLPQEQRQ